MRILPILFNTDMINAILDGRKTVTRRLIKAPILSKVEPPKKVTLKNGVANFEWNTQKTAGGFEIKTPYQPGDILYVRETWCSYYMPDGSTIYEYRASDPNGNRRPTGPEYDDPYEIRKWRPSIHMPKEAARIWLKVKDVRVERLQEITANGKAKEGLVSPCCMCRNEEDGKCVGGDRLLKDCPIECIDYSFMKLWNSTIKKSDIDRYGWDANPWVWVIEFERCEKPEGI